MNRRPIALALFFLCALTGMAQNRPVRYTTYEVKYKCNDGRYTIKFAGEARHYCFDKVHYWDKDAPAYVKEYFQQLRADQAQQDADFNAAMAEHDAKFAKSGTTGPVSRGRSTGGASLVAPARPRPPARRVPAEQVRQIAAGTDSADVVAKLGQPAGRLSGLANGGESWTYLLESGTFAKVKFENGQVTSVVLPQ